jgi:DNA-binding response OmpR family regulator
MNMRPKVLVADDDDDILRLISERLTFRGYDVSTAGTGEVALEMALADPPDAAILDGIMPGLHGDEVCAALRADTRTADVPVLILTAKAADADEREALDAGADAYIVKPFRIAELDRRLKELLASAPRR